MSKKEKLEAFVGNLEQDANVLSIIVFGSYARGNDRPDSDIDLVVILKNGYRREVEYFEDQAFEIIYTTEMDAVDYWQANKHDGVGLWSVGRIVFDRGGVGEQLKKYGEKLCKEKPAGLDAAAIGHLRFDACDLIKAAEIIYKDDPATASLLIHKKAANLIDVYFDKRQQWRPAPKQQIEVISNSDNELGTLLHDFHTVSDFGQKILLLQKIVTHILGQNSAGK